MALSMNCDPVTRSRRSTRGTRKRTFTRNSSTLFFTVEGLAEGINLALRWMTFARVTIALLARLIRVRPRTATLPLLQFDNAFRSAPACTREPEAAFRAACELRYARAFFGASAAAASGRRRRFMHGHLTSNRRGSSKRFSSTLYARRLLEKLDELEDRAWNPLIAMHCILIA